MTGKQGAGLQPEGSSPGKTGQNWQEDRIPELLGMGMTRTERGWPHGD